MISDKEMTDSYNKHRNLKLAANELGMKWQTLYVHLKRIGVEVVGDKARYGSDSDRLAAKGEGIFKRLVPFSKDMNTEKFQSKIDFLVGEYSVDIKTSSLKTVDGGQRYAFSLKKQELVADFFVCFGIDDEDIECFLIPGDVARKYQNISISKSKSSKWRDYQVEIDDLSPFFSSIIELGAKKKA